MKYCGACFGPHTSGTLAHSPLIPSNKSTLLMSQVRFEDMLENKYGGIPRGRLSRHFPQRGVSACKGNGMIPCLLYRAHDLLRQHIQTAVRNEQAGGDAFAIPWISQRHVLVETSGSWQGKLLTCRL